MTKIAQPTLITILTTYRCPMTCTGCELSQQQLPKKKEITPEELKKFPKVKRINLKGGKGEPFVREDLTEIVRVCFTKSPRVVVYTAGRYQDRILRLAEEFPGIGIRIIRDSVSCKMKSIPSQQGEFDKGLSILLRLKEMGLKDIGFGYTVLEHNSEEMLSLYQVAKSKGLKFTTSASQKLYYAPELENVADNVQVVSKNIAKLIELQMKVNHPKSWFRAFYNMGLINHLEGNRGMLPCEAGTVNFFVDPYGEIYPCNAFDEDCEVKSMGNLRDASHFKDIWESEKAQHVRKMTRKCSKNCWMESTATPVMKKYIRHPAWWVLKNKLRSLEGKPIILGENYYNVGQNPKQGDFKNLHNIKIAITGTRGIPNILGGVETHCEELFPRIVPQNYDITIIRRKVYTTDTLHEYNGVQLVDVDTPQQKSFEAIIHTFRAIWVVRFKLHSHLIHIHAIGPAILTPLARLLGLKVIFTHHGADYEREKWGKMAKMVLKLGERMGVKYANEVIVISEVINNHIIEKYGRTDAHLILNGVNIPVKSTKTTYLDTLGLKKHNYVFAMGRFVPEKGFDLLIKVFAKMKLKNIHLVIAGDTDHEDNYSLKLKEQAKENGVILTGFIKGEKLNELLSNALFFVLPSTHEGLPIALLEAMSYNLNVLASDIPANVVVNLPLDCYFENQNEEDLTLKMKDKISSNVSYREYDLSAYNWDVIAEETATVYEETM